MTKIIGISGSLRRHSLNAALLRAAVKAMPEESTLEIATIKGIPLYNADIEEEEGTPWAVQILKEQIVACDALLLVTPEYNNSMPGVFKNAIDWLSRPPSDCARIFANRPVALIGASPGGFGTLLSQTAWLPVLKVLGTRTWSGGSLKVSQASSVFNETGELTNDKTKEQLQQFMRGFVDFINK